MSIKKNLLFSQNNLYPNLLNKKLLNKIFYHKSYIRSNLLMNKKLKIMDHYNTSSTLDVENLKSYVNNQ